MNVFQDICCTLSKLLERLERLEQQIFPILITAPDGAYPGATLIATGGTPVAATIDGITIVFDDDAPVIVPYRFVINGVETGDWFQSPGVIPDTVIEGDLIRVVDAVGRLSNTLTVTGANGAITYDTPFLSYDGIPIIYGT